MKMTLRTAVIATSTFVCTALFSLGWSEQGNLSLSVNKADAHAGVFYIHPGYASRAAYVHFGWPVLVRREGLLLGWPVEWPRVQLCRLVRLRDAQRHCLHAWYCDHGRRRHIVQLPIEPF